MPNRIYQDDAGRLIEHKDRSTKIHWSGYMEEKLRRLFPTTKNDDLAVEFNVSPRTVIRKAREMGLVKKIKPGCRSTPEKTANICECLT